MNYLSTKDQKVKGGRYYHEGDLISNEEWNSLDEDSQGGFEETNITDAGQTQEQADAAEAAAEEAKKKQEEAMKAEQEKQQKQAEQVAEETEQENQ